MWTSAPGGNDPELSDYWYQGKAELNRYALQQNRYDNVHPGEAVLIFVTEDFLTDKMVKNERYQNPNSVPVLKANMLRKFPTGIYDYSVMTSVFTPVAGEENRTLKVSNTSQEWCGHTYLQATLSSNQYKTVLHSYFEEEADRKDEVPAAVLEDELYNRIRLSPDNLPTGTFDLIPATTYLRFAHRPFEPTPVRAIRGEYLGDIFEGESLMSYRLEMPELERTVEIVYRAEAPFIIEGWTETYPSAFDRKSRTTTARRTHTLRKAYWQFNGLEDMSLRSDMGR